MKPRVILSDKFRLEILKRRAAGLRVYEIAAAAMVRRTDLSGMVCGSVEVRRDDPRVLRVAAFLGLPAAECFEDDAERIARQRDSERAGDAA